MGFRLKPYRPSLLGDALLFVRDFGLAMLATALALSFPAAMIYGAVRLARFAWTGH